MLTTVLLAGCQTPEQQTTVPEDQNVTTEELVDNPNKYIGQVVTVRSEPVAEIGPSTFTMEDEEFFGSEPILVVNATGELFVFPEAGTDVQVTGEVRNFVALDIEREYNLGLEADDYATYENQPALIAQSIAIAPEPGELASNPEQYYGEQLAVTGEIEEFQSANVFTLDEDQLFGGQDLLVLRANPTTAAEPAIEDGETVAVTGELRPFIVAELERDYEFNWEAGIQEQLEAEYRDRPVLVADNVYPSAIPDDDQ
ncbi:hypothetical protein ACQ4M4_14755 [Leptolyngbya sp. AN02str]|uniref:hypothetical protein n=1 Tax=Leptolyngbya sp. AN02str TaxID=3423363 RepID=UPI003D3109A7